MIGDDVMKISYVLGYYLYTQKLTRGKQKHHFTPNYGKQIYIKVIKKCSVR